FCFSEEQGLDGVTELVLLNPSVSDPWRWLADSDRGPTLLVCSKVISFSVADIYREFHHSPPFGGCGADGPLDPLHRNKPYKHWVKLMFNPLQKGLQPVTQV